MRIHPAIAPILCLAIGGNLRAADPAARTETRTEPLAYGAKLWVKNCNGRINVTGWDAEAVTLTAEIQEADKRHIELVTRRLGANLVIEARTRQPFSAWSFGPSGRCHCQMTLNVPRRILAYFSTRNGPISVAGLDGYAHCDTSNGDITVRDLTGEARTETTNGALDLKGLRARIKGGTTNGRILLEDVEGGVSLETTNGSIRSRNLDGWGEGIRLATTNGPIDLELGKAAGEIKAVNLNGAMEVDLPSGRVVEKGRHHAHLVVPGSRQMITLRTTNGGIRIH